MKYLIVNADDFGLTKGVTDGIAEAFEFGVVSSTTMFANSEYFDYAVEIAKKNPLLGVGVHLTLTYGKPVSLEIPSVTDMRGHFPKEPELNLKLKSMKSEEIEREFAAQIDKLLDAGIAVTHLDTHNHMHKIDKVAKIVSKLALKYKIAVRQSGNLHPAVKTTEKFTESFRNDAATELNFKLLVKKYEKYQSLEIMCHPGHFDEELLRKSRYAKMREVELKVLSKYELQAHLDSFNIKLINFGELSD